jgi:hypothetical protein
VGGIEHQLASLATRTDDATTLSRQAMERAVAAEAAGRRRRAEPRPSRRGPRPAGRPRRPARRPTRPARRPRARSRRRRARRPRRSAFGSRRKRSSTVWRGPSIRSRRRTALPSVSS